MDVDVGIDLDTCARWHTVGDVQGAARGLWSGAELAWLHGMAWHGGESRGAVRYIMAREERSRYGRVE